MTSKLIPSNPEEVMVIREIAPGVTTLSVPFLRFGLIKFGGRATIVKLTSGALAIFSPVALTPTVHAHLKTLSGPLSYIIAPDLEHHIFLSSWSSAFPSAKILAPEGLPEKRASMNATDKSVTLLDFHTVFTTAAKKAAVDGKISVDKEFDADFEVEYVDAHPNKELVFLHKPSRTLIEADLLFNLPATEQYSKTGENASSGWATKLFGHLQNTRGDATWQRRMVWYVFAKGDREGFGKSVRRISGWGFENLVPCHGETVVGGGKEVFNRVFGWFLEGKK